MKYLFIALGGIIGALARYLISGWVQSLSNGSFPWGTLCVNMAGSFIIGITWSIFDTVIVSNNLKILVMIGILGSFTTFSTFSLETFHMLRDSEYTIAAFNVAASVFFSILCVFAGFFITRYILETIM